MSAGQFIQWQDLFVIVDDGAIPLARYDRIETAIRDQARACPRGVAVFVILPPEARPPPEDVRLAVKRVLVRLAQSISCLAYVVEGTGFKGVAARATLVGMKIFSSRPYPIYVETSLVDGLTKVMSHLAAGHTTSIETLVKMINEARLSWQPPPPEPVRDNELTAK